MIYIYIYTHIYMYVVVKSQKFLILLIVKYLLSSYNYSVVFSNTKFIYIYI